MLSILIPIYNYDSRPLVTELHELLSNSGILGEIICLDDGSEANYERINSELSRLEFVTYESKSKNLGRAAIRNELVRKAQYKNLLFLDCDSLIIKSDFLERYQSHFNKGAIVSGGREYAVRVPEDSKFLLHWTYGIRKESRTLAERQQHPVRYFHTNNFLVSKELISENPFDEKVEGYGYEDILFAKRLSELGCQVLHIDNPIMHAGLDNTTKFISKTQEAIANLKRLNAQGLELDTKLEIAANRIKRWGAAGLYVRYFKNKENKLLQNLNSTNPNLRNLDLLKLYWYL